MFEQLQNAVVAGPEVPVRVLALRLVMGLLGGGLVAWIYRRARGVHGTESLPATLVMLAVLICAVTQVIGDSMARAFSLVGALSIVRFRTVVRDTRDTAFVIFVVVVGMAVGAGHALVAGATVVVAGVAAWLMAPGRFGESVDDAGHDLTIKLGLGQDGTVLEKGVFAEHLTRWRSMGASTAKQGSAIELVWRVTLRGTSSPGEVVRALNRVDGVQGVELHPADDSD